MNDHEVEALVASVTQRVRQLAPDAASAVAVEALNSLRRKRRFGAMSTVAEHALRAGVETPTVHRQYAQALIEQGLLDAALAKLESLERRGNLGNEALEVRGLVGRANKQMYVEMPTARSAPRALGRAIDAYYAAYRAQPEVAAWHGINAAALIERARLDGHPVAPDLPSSADLARQILGQVEQQSPAARTFWDDAIAAEACVALQDYQGAAGWLNAYVRNPTADAFEFGSTLRQLRQVWRLDETQSEQRALLVLLEAHTLRATGGSITARVADQRQRHEDLARDETYLEAVFGAEQYRTITWYRAGLDCAAGVVRIRRTMGQTLGTGFLIPGEYLRPDWTGTMLVATNFHVVNAAGAYPGAAFPTVELIFEGRASEQRTVEAVRWESAHGPVGQHPPAGRDIALLVPKAPVLAPPSYALAPILPAAGERIYVIGYPLGQELAFSLHDNELLAASTDLLHYRSPTQRGSSGSPLFNDRWELIGYHHGGKKDLPNLSQAGEVYDANEGFVLRALGPLIHL